MDLGGSVFLYVNANASASRNSMPQAPIGSTLRPQYMWPCRSSEKATRSEKGEAWAPKMPCRTLPAPTSTQHDLLARILFSLFVPFVRLGYCHRKWDTTRSRAPRAFSLRCQSRTSTKTACITDRRHGPATN